MTLVNFIECFMPRAVNSVGYSVINYFRSFLLSRFLFLSVETKMVLSCWAWWWRRKYPQAIFTLESQKSLELWKWAERNEDIRNWMEEGIPIFANNPILQHPEPRCTVRTVRTKTTTDEISEISDWTRTDEIFKILDQFGLNLSGLITWLNPLAVELAV